MEKIWLKEYPQGVPAEIDINGYASLKAMLEESFEKYADLPAFSNMGTTLSFAELETHSRHFAAYLQQVLRLKKGERVALMMPNILQYPVALFGILRAGLVAVNVNPLYTAHELEHQLKDSGARAIIILENFASTMEQVGSNSDVETVIVTALGDLLGFLKGTVVNFVVRDVKKMVPSWHIDKAKKFRDVLAEGANHEMQTVELGHELPLREMCLLTAQHFPGITPALAIDPVCQFDQLRRILQTGLADQKAPLVFGFAFSHGVIMPQQVKTQKQIRGQSALSSFWDFLRGLPIFAGPTRRFS